MRDRLARRVAAYVYTGWHPIPERDASFHPGFTEWELVRACKPRFEGHLQPRVPLLGEYDDRDPAVAQRSIELARRYGIDAFVFGVFWCRGKRVFEAALDEGFLGAPAGRDFPFACMWANRMPRRVLPVRRRDLPVVADERRVPSDVEDFVRFVSVLAESYFARPNYLTVGGRSYLSIYDSSFFVRELGLEAAREAIGEARAWLAAHGHRDLHLAAIEPNRESIGSLADLGFDSVTHYVLLPDWRGPQIQDYDARAELSAAKWPDFAERSGLPYMPSVATSWDASPRAADFGPARPDQYPWSPVLVNATPAGFERALRRAFEYPAAPEDALVFVASWNEWSEGHFLEPDQHFGYGYLEALRAARAACVRD